jgi:hypothetical protein
MHPSTRTPSRWADCEADTGTAVIGREPRHCMTKRVNNPDEVGTRVLPSRRAERRINHGEARAAPSSGIRA